MAHFMMLKPNERTQNIFYMLMIWFFSFPVTSDPQEDIKPLFFCPQTFTNLSKRVTRGRAQLGSTRQTQLRSSMRRRFPCFWHPLIHFGVVGQQKQFWLEGRLMIYSTTLIEHFTSS